MTAVWHRDSQFLILLGVPDEDSLFAYADRFAELGVECSLMREPDYGDQATALAVAPSEHWRLLSSLPLLGKEVTAA